MNDIRLVAIDGGDFLEVLGGDTPSAIAFYLNVKTKHWECVVAREPGPEPIDLLMNRAAFEPQGPEWVRIVVARNPVEPSDG